MSSESSCSQAFGLFLALLLVIAAAGCGQTAQSVLNNSDRDHASEEAVENQVVADFGVIKPSGSAKMSVKLPNPNPTEVTIAKFVAGCGCTAATIDDPTIPGFGSTSVEVTFRAGSETANYERYVQVDAITGPFARIKVLAKVRDDLQILPTQLFKTVSVKEMNREVPTTISILNYTESDWSGIRVTSPDAWVTIGHPVDADTNTAENPSVRQTWRVKLDLAQAADFKPGIYNSLLYVANLPDRSIERQIPIHVTVRSPYVVLPLQIVFRADDFLRSKTIVITGVELNDGSLDVDHVTGRIVSEQSRELLKLSDVRRKGRSLLLDISRTEIPVEKHTTATIELVLSRNNEVIGRVEVIIL